MRLIIKTLPRGVLIVRFMGRFFVILVKLSSFLIWMGLLFFDLPMGIYYYDAK
jgi:hypothetical protein